MNEVDLYILIQSIQMVGVIAIVFAMWRVVHLLTGVLKMLALIARALNHENCGQVEGLPEGDDKMPGTTEDAEEDDGI